ncbi:MAG TPA: hypothetical protein VKK79_00455 [Candidatus Lokiarchaeia archaeon]|nr:hypothetical protein [Candidatus Lokiarchaeia archaeon]
MAMEDIHTPEFREELKKLVEEILEGSLETYKLQHLREIFLTREEFKEEMESQRAEFREDMTQQRAEFKEEMEKMNLRFDETHQDIQNVLRVVQNIQRQLGPPFEQFARTVVERILEGEGAPGLHLVAKHFPDLDMVVSPDSEDVQVDGYSDNPPVIIEATAVLREREKVGKFLRKKKLVEQITGQQFRGFFIASDTEFSQDEMGDIAVELHEQGCELLAL